MNTINTYNINKYECLDFIYFVYIYIRYDPYFRDRYGTLQGRREHKDKTGHYDLLTIDRISRPEMFGGEGGEKRILRGYMQSRTRSQWNKAITALFPGTCWMVPALMAWLLTTPHYDE